MARVKVDGFMCERCTYIWVPKRGTKHEPKLCPKCKSPLWNKARKLDLPLKRRAARWDEKTRTAV